MYKSRAKMLHRQYTWDDAKRHWEDPKECRDTCAECCTEAMHEHPLKDGVCSHVCHKSCGIQAPPPLISARQRAHPVNQDKPQTSTIDYFAPAFSGFINSNSGFLGRGCYRNSGLREPYQPQLDDDEMGAQSRLAEHQHADVMMTFSVTEARSRLVMELPKHIEENAEKLAAPPNPDQAVLDHGIVADTFSSHAQEEGITLIEVCAGISSGLEAVPLNGWKVTRYIYVDIDPIARDIARFRVANFSARFTMTFPPSVWMQAFTLPHDINAIIDFHLDHHFACRQEQIMVMAGWPCRDYSPAWAG
jgi:hypothetical protein